MSFAITTGAIALVGTGAQIYYSSQQQKQAKKLREQTADPGIQRNYALDRVSNTLFDRYSNYDLPGYNRYVDQIQSNMASANRQAMMGATSSADVLNAVTSTQAVSDQSLASLSLQDAGGREQALMRYLDSLSAQGQDQLRINEIERDRYDATLREAAALEGAATQNLYSGFQDALTAGTAIAGNFAPRTSISPVTGEVIQLPSVWDQMYGRKKNNNFTVLPGAQITR